jgi:hypothetical protein
LPGISLNHIKTGCEIRRFCGFIGNSGQSQKEGQDDQKEIQELGGDPLAHHLNKMEIQKLTYCTILALLETLLVFLSFLPALPELPGNPSSYKLP